MISDLNNIDVHYCVLITYSFLIYRMTRTAGRCEPLPAAAIHKDLQ